MDSELCISFEAVTCARRERAVRLDEQKSNAALSWDLPHPSTGKAIGSNKSPMQERHNARLSHVVLHTLLPVRPLAGTKEQSQKYAQEYNWPNKSLQIFIDLGLSTARSSC
jgi:hypothetical protein